MGTSGKDGWTVIRERNERRQRAEERRKPAWSMEEATGTTRLQNSHKVEASYLERLLMEEKRGR